MKLYLQNFILFFLRGYQRTLSPDHGWFRLWYPLGYCRFYPSCSQYCLDSVRVHGLHRGLFRAFLRLLRCHPFSRGGLDPV